MRLGPSAFQIANDWYNINKMHHYPEVILFIAPQFKERIWGGRKLNEYGYVLPKGNIGECWGISGHPQGESLIASERFKGQTLLSVYQKHPNLFNHPKRNGIPLLIKIIDAKEDLSVQVHPNDDYALKHENQNGKHEAWIVLETTNNARLQLGHRAKNQAMFNQMVLEEKWDDLLLYRSIQKDEVIDIQPGTLHALCAGTMVLEIQQSSDVTYRVYDYQRQDQYGKFRQLHLAQAMAVTTSPFIEPPVNKLNRMLLNTVQTLVDNNHFCIQALGVNQEVTIVHPRHRYATVIDGMVMIEGVVMKKGQHAMITNEINHLTITGQGWIIFAEAKEF